MIIQGGNIPIRIEFEPREALPAEPEISVAIQMPGIEIKHWDTGDLIISDDGLTVEAPISQEESLEWERGDVKIEVKWINADGKTMFAFSRDKIIAWSDKTVLSEEVSV